ncbi:MAG TPA: hypothetical protein VIY48_12195 [Candidatus Paceibacterota bacterium]
MEKRKPWFRWYRDTVMDAKLRFVHRRASDLAWPNRADKSELVVSLTDAVATWALILESVTDDNGSVTVPSHHTVTDYISEALDMDPRHAAAIVQAMQDYSLLIEKDGGLQVKNWQHRQYLDVTNAERQARYREAHKHNASVTESNGERNGSVTHSQRQSTESESETDTESKKNKKKKSSRALGAPIPPDWEPDITDIAWAKEKGYQGEDLKTQTEMMKNWALSNANRGVARKLDWSKTWRNWVMRSLGNRAKPQAPIKQAYWQGVVDKVRREALDADKLGAGKLGIRRGNGSEDTRKLLTTASRPGDDAEMPCPDAE